jgi:hypothetical protein
MKNILVPALLLVLACSWTVPASSAQGRPGGPGAGTQVLAAALAPDLVPAFPSPAPTHEKTPIRDGNVHSPKDLSVQKKVRSYLDETIPLLPPSWTEREKYWAAPPAVSFASGTESGGAAWNEFYLRNFRLSLSSMPNEDDHLKHLVPGETQESHRWEQFRNLPGQLRSGSFRDTAESLGVVVEPRIRLGIEF